MKPVTATRRDNVDANAHDSADEKNLEDIDGVPMRRDVDEKNLEDLENELQMHADKMKGSDCKSQQAVTSTASMVKPSPKEVVTVKSEVNVDRTSMKDEQSSPSALYPLLAQRVAFTTPGAATHTALKPDVVKLDSKICGKYLNRGDTCSSCKRKVPKRLSGIFCFRRKENGDTGGCGRGHCWACIKKGSEDQVGHVRPSKEDIKRVGNRAWWMHGSCMTSEDSIDYSTMMMPVPDEYTADEVPKKRRKKHKQDESRRELIETKHGTSASTNIEITLPVGWEKRVSKSSGRTFYYCRNSKITQWNPPIDLERLGVSLLGENRAVGKLAQAFGVQANGKPSQVVSIPSVSECESEAAGLRREKGASTDSGPDVGKIASEGAGKEVHNHNFSHWPVAPKTHASRKSNVILDPERIGKLAPKVGNVYCFNSGKTSRTRSSTAEADVEDEEVIRGTLRDAGRVIWKSKPVSERVRDLVAEIKRLDNETAQDEVVPISIDDEVGSSKSSSPPVARKPVQSGSDHEIEDIGSSPLAIQDVEEVEDVDEVDEVVEVKAVESVALPTSQVKQDRRGVVSKRQLPSHNAVGKSQTSKAPGVKAGHLPLQSAASSSQISKSPNGTAGHLTSQSTANASRTSKSPGLVAGQLPSESIVNASPKVTAKPPPTPSSSQIEMQAKATTATSGAQTGAVKATAQVKAPVKSMSVTAGTTATAGGSAVIAKTASAPASIDDHLATLRAQALEKMRKNAEASKLHQFQ